MSKPHYRMLADGNVMPAIRANDGLRNVLGNIMTDRDKASASAYFFSPLTQDQLHAAYRGSWLPRKIVNIPAFDATRKWREWSATKDQISAIEAEEKRLDVRGKIRRALISARLRGGAALLIGDGSPNPELPLNLERIRKGGIKYLTVLTRDSLHGGQRDENPESPYFNRPAHWTLSTTSQGQQNIHPSRLCVFLGAPIPEDAFDINDGWGDSVLDAVYQATTQADSTTANIASLVFEAKIDVIAIPGLMQNLADPRYEAQLTKRLQVAATMKSINGTLVRDDDEAYDQKTANFGTLPDIMDRFFQNVSGAADIPMTRLFGRSAAGMNATGDGDLKNYYDHVQSMQEVDIGSAIHILDEALIRSSLGTRPEDVFYQWRALWQMTEKERAEIGDKTMSAIEKLHRTDTVPPEAVGKAAVNALTESGAFPGLEAAVDEFTSGSAGQNENDPEGEGIEGLTDAAPRTLYVRRDVLNAGDIIAWAKKQGFNTTLPADDMHVTITFSRTPVDWMKMGEAWSEEIELPAGGARLMEQFGDARVLLFSSSELSWRHESMKREGATWDHPEYQPHITISYDADAPEITEIEAYTGKIRLGPEIFQEVKADWAERIQET